MKKILINIGIYTILVLIIVWLYHSNQKNKEAYSIAESNYKTELLAKNEVSLTCLAAIAIGPGVIKYVGT